MSVRLDKRLSQLEANTARDAITVFNRRTPKTHHPSIIAAIHLPQDIANGVAVAPTLPLTTIDSPLVQLYHQRGSHCKLQAAVRLIGRLQIQGHIMAERNRPTQSRAPRTRGRKWIMKLIGSQTPDVNPLISWAR
jgi:hypothetical protein